MEKVDIHIVELVVVFPSGSEEWHCPVCDCRFIVQWVPTCTVIFLQDGDEHALHVRSVEGLAAEAVLRQPALVQPAAEPQDRDKLEQGPWGEWLDQIDLGDL